jgi:hypothetical protein
MKEDIKQVKEDVNEIRAEILPIEEKAAETDIKIQCHDVEINCINQNALRNQMIMINIAPSIVEDQFLNAMNQWTNNLTKDSFNSIKLIKVQDTQTAIMDFTTMIHKKKFLDFVKGKQKDQQKKYIPILNEHIFQLPETDIHRPNVIEFRTAMTKINRAIFNKAREQMKVNKSIEGVWIAYGAVFMRIKNIKKPHRLDSVNQLTDLMASLAMERNKGG